MSATAPSAAPPALHVDLARRFPGGLALEVLLALELPPPRVVALFGPSGAGKTTLLRCLAGLERPDRGEVRFAGETWFDAGARVDVPPQRRGVGLLFQDHALFPHLTVAENVGYGVPRRDRARVVEGLLRRFELEALAGRRPGALSGGEQQRVALARALAPAPRLLLLDEPLSALDLPLRARLRGELRALLRELALPTLVVTHDHAEALALADEVVVLGGGRVLQVGAPAVVFDRPADREVARIVGVETLVPARVEAVATGPGPGSRATLAVGPVRLAADLPGGGAAAPAAPRPGDDAWACVRAHAVALSAPAGPGEGEPAEGANRLVGRVARAVDEGALLRVTVDCGLPLVALVPRRDAARLDLAEGARVTATIDPAAVHVVTS